MAHKLTYTITGRRPTLVGGVPYDLVAVEWRHADGPVTDTVLLPTGHPPLHPSMPPVEFVTVPAGTRSVIHDQIDVPRGTPDSVVCLMCEEKRARLAANLGIDP